jgi:hypothetical protein
MTLNKDFKNSMPCAPTRAVGAAGRSLLMCLLLAAAASAHAEHGRDFSALYDIGRVTTIDAHRVSVTLLLRLRNNSGRYVSNGSIRLVDRSAPGEALATLGDPVEVAYRASARVAGTVTVERSEYQRWVRGDAPKLVVNVIDARGRHVDHPVELVRLPGAGASP